MRSVDPSCGVSCKCKLLCECKDAVAAKALAFHRDVRTRCITLQGDDFNPSGTLTGAR